MWDCTSFADSVKFNYYVIANQSADYSVLRAAYGVVLCTR